jgi:hypothetical protein
MGLFGKIKQNLNHGGVKIDVQAPASVSVNDATLPVTVSITNGEAQQSVKRVTAEIIATSRNATFSQPSRDGFDNTQPMTETVARAENVEPFTLQPGEVKSVQLNITMNAGAAAGAQLPEGSGLAKVAGALQKLQTVTETLNKGSYTYDVRATVDVDGIALDPAKSQPLQILNAGQIGGAVNIQL